MSAAATFRLKDISFAVLARVIWVHKDECGTTNSDSTGVQTIPHRTHTRALFPVAHFTRDCTCGSRGNRLKTIRLRASKIIPSSVMSLLGVPLTPFLPVFSSPSTAQTTPATSPAQSTGIRLHPCATPLGDGLSGRLAGPIPNTNQPKFCIDVDSEHTPINVPSRNMSFQQEYDATIAASEDTNLPRHSVASSSSQHSAASSVPTLSKLGSVRTCSRKLLADFGAVVSRTCIQETCADMDRETVVSKTKRDRDQNVVQSLRDRLNLHKFLDRKAEFAVKGEKLAQQRLHEAGAEVETTNWKNKDSDVAFS